jgi:hypothetical protein
MRPAALRSAIWNLRHDLLASHLDFHPQLKQNPKGTSLMGKTIGIDLGTTNSCFAVMVGGEPTVL